MTRQPSPAFEAQRLATRRYFARWKDWQAQGNAPVVITRREQPQHWQAWRAYYRANGLQMLIEMMDDRSEKTVPCLSPADFDTVEIQPDRRVKD